MTLMAVAYDEERSPKRVRKMSEVTGHGSHDYGKLYNTGYFDMWAGCTWRGNTAPTQNQLKPNALSIENFPN